MTLSDSILRVGRGAAALVFPPRCLLCGVLVQSDGGLCPDCWGNTAFLAGLCCDSCGTPLIGPDPGIPVRCDTCRDRPPPWQRGRAVFRYARGGRRLVLGLKHGDRTDLVPGMARWMAARAAPLIRPDTLVVPVPLHWRRLAKRRYNQSALLANALARQIHRPCCPDFLIRPHATRKLDGLSAEERFAQLDEAIGPNPRRRGRAEGRAVLLVDDVMTSGATLSVSAQACLKAGAARVDVVVLARVCRDD
ncbi:MAG: ComF family protein [Qingshengfaniella sp.]